MGATQKLAYWEKMMKKLLALVLALSFGLAGAQTQRARRSRIPTGNRVRGVPAKHLMPTAPATSAPIFLRRRGVATINEMMIQPPAFSYGSSINIWILKDKSGRTREIAETGHADSATCRRVSSQLMSLFLEKNKEAEDLVVAGASHFVDHGELGITDVLLKQPRVQEFISAQRELWAAEQVVRLLEDSPGEGADDKSVLQKAREALVLAQRRVEDMRNDPLIQEYLRESSSAEAINTFISEVGRFSHENGLVNIREIPFEPIEQARARIATAAASSRAQVISFEDLLQASGTREAALFTPVLTVPGGRPLELRIPLASLHTANFDEAQRNNRDEVERAIVGNANDRLEVFNDAKARYLQGLRDCGKLSAEELRKVVMLTEVCTAEGVCYKPDKPERITMKEYCTIRLPLNVRLVDRWIGHTKELLKTIADDGKRKDGSRILAFDYATLVDSMLRDWRLPVPRSQVAFDNWRGTARGPVWSLLTAQLSRIGIAPDVIGGEQMVFSVQLDGQDLVVRPMHVIDMARSVLVADPASGATRVLDAWSMRSETAAVTAPVYVSSEGEGLVSDSIRLLAAGDRDDAEARIAAAFSRDPAAAFRSVEREWLGQFPDTHERMLKIQESLKPLVEAIEWKEALETIKSDPSSKEGIRLEIEALHAFLESYPKAPVDLQLSFALQLTGYLAEIQNELNKRGHLPSNPPEPLNDWNVLQAYIPRTMPSQTAARGHRANRIGGGVGPGAPSAVNRKRLEESLSAQGYKGIRLQKALAALLSIQAIAGGRLSGNSYLEARAQLAMTLLADPAPMIREALKTVIDRAPSYWASAVQAGGLPKERSEEWKEADRETQRELTLFEAEAQLLARLEDELRKVHSGLIAADALSSDRSPNLAQLLPVIDAAVGDGRTGSSPAFRRPQQTVKLFSEQRRVMDLLTRLQNASYLRGGVEELLAIARSRISSYESPEAFRDAMPLRANVWFESGDYLRALEALLTPEAPLALYSPTLSWHALPGDGTSKPVSVSARRESSGVAFRAIFNGGRNADVLALEGLSPAEIDALLKDFPQVSEQSWSEYGKVSDQILLTPVALRPELRKLRDLLLGPKLRTLLVKSMVYGRNAPGVSLVRQSANTTVPERTLETIDRVNGDQGRNYRVPSLDEVKQLAISKTKTRQ
jgi:hypothetical protein